MRAHLIVLTALIAGPALAAAPVPVEAPMSTASSSTSVADQIDAYLKSSPALEVSDDTPQGVVPSDDRKLHGEVSIGIGTRGYRSVYARTDLPVGENGRLSIAIEDARFNGRGGFRGGGRRSVGANLALGVDAPVERQRCGQEDMTPPRPLDAIGGPHGRCHAPPFGR